MAADKTIVIIPGEAGGLLVHLEKGSHGSFISVTRESITAEEQEEFIRRAGDKEGKEDRIKKYTTDRYKQKTDNVIFARKNLGVITKDLLLKEHLNEVKKNIDENYSEVYTMIEAGVELFPKKDGVVKELFLVSGNGCLAFADFLTNGYTVEKSATVIASDDKAVIDSDFWEATKNDVINLIVIVSPTKFSDEDVTYYRRLADSAKYAVIRITLPIKPSVEASDQQNQASATKTASTETKGAEITIASLARELEMEKSLMQSWKSFAKSVLLKAIEKNKISVEQSVKIKAAEGITD